MKVRFSSSECHFHHEFLDTFRQKSPNLGLDLCSRLSFIFESFGVLCLEEVCLFQVFEDVRDEFSCP